MRRMAMRLEARSERERESEKRKSTPKMEENSSVFKFSHVFSCHPTLNQYLLIVIITFSFNIANVSKEGNFSSGNFL